MCPKVQVKVIGGNNPNFISGETDLRGVFVAEGVRGQAAAVARKGTAQYAFYRGQTPLGPPPAAQPNAPAEAKPTQTVPATQTPALDQNLKSQNFSNQSRNIERLQERVQGRPRHARRAGRCRGRRVPLTRATPPTGGLGNA